MLKRLIRILRGSDQSKVPLRLGVPVLGDRCFISTIQFVCASQQDALAIARDLHARTSPEIRSELAVDDNFMPSAPIYMFEAQFRKILIDDFFLSSAVSSVGGVPEDSLEALLRRVHVVVDVGRALPPDFDRNLLDPRAVFRIENAQEAPDAYKAAVGLIAREARVAL